MDNFAEALTKNLDELRFTAKISGKDVEELVKYNDMCGFIEDEGKNEDGSWNYTEILRHRHASKGKGKKKKRHKFEVLLKWVSGEQSWEPISTAYHADKFELAQYAEDHDLVELWDSKTIRIKDTLKILHETYNMIAVSKLNARDISPIYMFGVRVPRNHNEAMELDRLNKNNYWAEAEALEISQLQSYETFEDLGHKDNASRPEGHKRISLHFVYAVKHDGRHKARAVAGGHMTETPVESTYASVVSLRGIRMVIFLAELNRLQIWQTDVGNAYLEAMTQEKVYVIAGDEFGQLKGNVLVIKRALYGLKSSSS